MIEIDEDCTIEATVTVVKSGKQSRIHIPKTFEDNGCTLDEKQEVKLYMDKKNRIVFFRYDSRRRRTNGKNNSVGGV